MRPDDKIRQQRLIQGKRALTRIISDRYPSRTICGHWFSRHFHPSNISNIVSDCSEG